MDEHTLTEQLGELTFHPEEKDDAIHSKEWTPEQKPKEQDDTVTSSSPVVVLCIGMAGSGKTTFIQRLNSHLHGLNQIPYVMNLDPAVTNVPFTPNLDIRDSVDYKNVMSQYGLGPNGAILTSLNLFSTKFDQVMDLVEKREDQVKRIIVDTPGQIEVFTWSASGMIITESLATRYPTIVAYILDTPRCTQPATFMSNMLYACSILYKTRLPLLIVFNKTDVLDAEFAQEWMSDFEAFQEALDVEQGPGSEEMGTGSYMITLVRSMALVLDEFYQHLKSVRVSAMTGEGMDDFLCALETCVQRYHETYGMELQERRTQRQLHDQQKREREMKKLQKDLDAPFPGAPTILSGSSMVSETTHRGYLQEDLDEEEEEEGDSEWNEEMPEKSEMDELERSEYEAFTRELLTSPP